MGKKGKIKAVTNETLKTLVQQTEKWLSLPEYKEFSNVAKRFFESILYGVTDLQQLPEKVNHHLSCYRVFTDLTKLVREKSCATKSKLGERSTCCDTNEGDDYAPSKNSQAKNKVVFRHQHTKRKSNRNII